MNKNKESTIKKNNILFISFLFVVINLFFLSYAYSLYSERLAIDGSLVVRSNNTIRITSAVFNSGSSNNATMAYSPEYTVNTISGGVTLGTSTSSYAIYDVTLVNMASNSIMLTNVTKSSWSNTDIDYTLINLVKNSTLIPAASSYNFQVKINYKSGLSSISNRLLNYILSFTFTEVSQLSVISIPNSANIVFMANGSQVASGTGSLSYHFVPNTSVTYTVSKAGYSTVSETLTIDRDITKNITLVGNTYTVTLNVNSQNDYDYTGSEDTYTPQLSGTYELKVWGAQGGTSNTLTGGNGGYSTGTTTLTPTDKLYINVGGKGADGVAGTIAMSRGGYNGGGNGYISKITSRTTGSGGGGATHIAKSHGVLSSLADDTDNILLVAGGGGGSYYDTDKTGYTTNGGVGGGTSGGAATIVDGSCRLLCKTATPTGGTQTGGGLGITSYSSGTTSNTKYVGTFGQGATGTASYGGGGGGWYGGASGQYMAGAGGSGYIGNLASASTSAGTSSIPTPAGGTATGNSGDGYARVTWKTSSINVVYGSPQTNLPIPRSTVYQFNGWKDTSNNTVTPQTIYSTLGNNTYTATWTNDVTAPSGTLRLTPSNDIIYAYADVSDNLYGTGIKTYGYILQQTSTCPSSGYIETKNPSYIFSVEQDGTYYVCSKITDYAGNSVTVSSSVNITISNITSYNESILNGAYPRIDAGMIPVVYDTSTGTTLVKTISKYNSNWYSYANKKWANVVLVTDESRYKYLNTEGVTVLQDDILAYYVWVPRYRYKIWTNALSTTGNETSVDVVFEDSETAKSTGTAVNSYRTHPAFTFGNTELNGLWIGKFETTGTSSNPTIKPDDISLKSNRLAVQFQISQLFGGITYGSTNKVDAHMLKASEWGAVTYLAYSNYGLKSEVYFNNSSAYYTGRSCGTIAVNSPTNAAQYPNENNASNVLYTSLTGYYTWDGRAIAYDGTIGDYAADPTKGTKASTTGNLYGIYDMSGGAYEHVMSVLADSNGNPRSGYTRLLNSGFNGTVIDDGIETTYSSGVDFPDSKYYDLFTTTDKLTACGGSICYGYALSETNEWYGTIPDFISTDYPWLKRGGYNLANVGGLSATAYGSGNLGLFNTFRSIIVNIS